MSRYKILTVLCLALAAVLVVMTLMPSKPAPAANGKALAAPHRKAVDEVAPRAKPERAPGRTQPAQARPKRQVEESGDAVQPSEAAGPAPVSAEARTPREQAVAVWESLVDQVIEQKDAPAAEQAQRVKEAFDKLDKEDQMDGIHRSLNLFPDEQFPALYAILFDKAENPEVLDAIFSDALNRSEEIKNPLMKELRKDREHPMFFESARILDVVEPMDGQETPAPTPSP